MIVHLACGGTGGHFFPGVATAEALCARGHEVTLWLAGKDVERQAASAWEGPTLVAPCEGFPSGFSLRAVRSAARLGRAVQICVRAMRREGPPDVVLGMGSFASVGPGAAALRLRIPLVLHEANVVPGRAVRLLAVRADAVAAAFEETRYHLRRRRLTVTGMPLRRALAEAADAEADGPTPDAVLIAGGSRGAQRLNRTATAAIARAARAGFRFPVVHLAGAAEADEVRAAYAAAGLEAEVHAFQHDMAPLYRRAALAVCRAGAATCAELAAFGVPALLVPYPYATNNHQEANALALERTGAAHMVRELSLDSEWLAEYLVGSLRAPDRLRRMRTAARQRARTDGAAALADLVERVGRARA